jgi:CRP-like cAMP-binding protein
MKLFGQDTKVDAFRRATMFEGLSRKQLVQLARASEELEVPAGKVLCREGEVGQEFFVIIDGEVGVTKNSKKKRQAAGGARRRRVLRRDRAAQGDLADGDGHRGDATSLLCAHVQGLPATDP